MLQDLRLGIRQLTAAPGFCLAVVLTLCLGIGVNTAVFSLLHGFLLRPLPYAQPDRVAGLVVHKQGTSPRTGRTFQEEDNSFDGDSWALLQQSLDSGTLASFGGTTGANLKSAEGAVRYVQASRVSQNYFNVLGVPFSLGRGFTANEDRPHGPSAVVLSYTLWDSLLHRDPTVIGKAINLKGEPFIVVGVLARNTVTPTRADLFTPLQPAPTGECGGPNCGIFLRLKDNATWQQVNAQLHRIHLPSYDQLERTNGGKAWLYARPLRADLSAAVSGKVAVLMASVLLILLIACANLAGLTLVRIGRREPEIATRLALGASRWRITRQLWTETVVLALLGGLSGVIFASFLLNYANRTLPDWTLPVGGLALDPSVLAFGTVAALFTSLLFGALPALQTRAFDLRSSLANASRTVARGSGRIRQSLIIAQVALTIVLLAASGLLTRTLLHLETQRLGFDPHQVITAKVSLDDSHYRGADAFHALAIKGVSALRHIPGVEDAAFALSVPYERGLNDGSTLLDGAKAGQKIGSSLTYVTDGFFSTLHIPLLAGRLLQASDTPTSEFVAVVNASFSRQFFHEPAAVGRHLRVSGNRYAIVGVVSDVLKKPGMHLTAPLSTEPLLYLPATQIDQGLANGSHIWFEPSWIVRSATSDLSTVAHQMQTALQSVDPSLPISRFSTMEQILQQQLEQQRIEVFLLGTLSGLALLLSTIGMYALVSNMVVGRTREIGIRLVLGSSVRQAMLHVGSAGLAAAFAGVLLGSGLSFVTSRLLASEIYGISLYDPLTLISVPLLLVSIAVVASLLPTVRITRLQPAETLRAE